MNTYDPDRSPDRAAWLQLDESERIDLVAEAHRKLGEALPGGRGTTHAAIHAVVETQIASEDPPEVAETLRRLRTEGLSRHDAVHAIGSILAGVMYDLTRAETVEGDPNEEYVQLLEDLDADEWLAGGG